MSEELYVFPVSFAQQRLWFLDQLEPGSNVYNVPMGVRLQGVLDARSLERAIGEIIRRHEAFRTKFAMHEGNPVQLVAPTADFTLPLLDLRALPDAQREAEAARLASENAGQAFDLERGSLLRARLVRLAEQEHVLLLTLHHIIFDGWSRAIFIRELTTLYEAFSAGRPSPLPELTIQYADFACWQREWLQGERLEAELDYWRTQLSGASVLVLPTDRPRPAVQSYRGSTYNFPLPLELNYSLKEMARRENVTLFMILLSAFQLLLARYSGQTDISVGTGVAGRNRAETENVIGFFINQLVIRTDLDGNPSFRELLKRVREVCLRAYAHQDVPFESVVEALQPERDQGRSPLFQVMFMMQNTPQETLTLKGLELSSMESDHGVSRFDLSLSIAEVPSGLSAMFEYSSALFDETTIVRMSRHYQRLLEAVAADPNAPVMCLPLLSPEEQRQILSEWNETQLEYEREATVHELIAAQVERTPERTAVVFRGQQLSYLELDRKAAQLARRLQASGVGPESVVGIYMTRSVELLVALLGVLKAGGAYVPLDPQYPPKRLAFMMEDSGMKVLLTQKRLVAGLPEASGFELVCLDADWQDGVRHDAPPRAGANAHNLAYVIYTSGSTGRPKGVMVTHRNVVNFFAAMRSNFGAEEGGTWLAVTSISFDISVLELLWTLTRGFRVVIQPELEAALSPSRQAERKVSDRKMEFSLFYFASDNVGESAADKYRLLIEGAKFADTHGFTAVWTPERHFHAFGGLYPNPSLTGAALATITERIALRAGSVVLPLHHPVRVAEEWAVVDNLSHGRVGLSFASGWHAADFVFAPENYARRREVMASQIETVRRLWRGEAVNMPDGSGRETHVRILPRPVQAELPVWLTSSGSPQTFQQAGELGFKLLTHLLGQSVEELGEKITLYREAWARAGHPPGQAHVTLMLHTFVGEDLEEVKDKVRKPFTNYLESSLDLMKNLALSLGKDPRSEQFTEDDRQALLIFAFERYFGTSGLMGTTDTCLEMIERLKAVGVDEVACLVDFGVDYESVIGSLDHLNELRLISNGQKPDADEVDYTLAAQLTSQQVTHMQCTPSLASMIQMEPDGLASLAGLEKLLLGGEALPAWLVKRLGEATSAEIHNMYGPTETTIWSATHQLNPADERVPIGRPLANTQIYILNERLEAQPVGVPGQIYIGGDGVARGYFRRPDLTADRFIPNPYSSEPGARLYQTGDVGHYLPDGVIEFVGRADEQVKIRGHRIELGEIELALAEHESIAETVVIVRNDEREEKRLVAYFVPVEGHRPGTQELRAHLRQRLPSYMMPEAFVLLVAFPLTPNGKIDKKALPAPEEAQDEAGDTVVNTRTQTEELLATLWCETLGLRQVGIHDNFFELGGHSLKATQLIARIREVFMVEVALRRLFEYPTVAGFAQCVEQARSEAQNMVAPPLVPVARDGEQLPLSFNQEWRMAYYRAEKGEPEPFRGANCYLIYSLRGPLDAPALARSLNEIVRRHEVLRTVYLSEGKTSYQVIKPELILDLPVVDLSELPEAARKDTALQIARQESLRRFYVAEGPLIRSLLLRLEEDLHVIVVAVEHLVFDDWSYDIFLQEVTVLYEAFVNERPSPLPDLPIQYADYAHWQRNWLRGEAREAYIGYWRKQLDERNPFPALKLPFERPTTSRTIRRGGQLSRKLEQPLVKALENLARREGVTLFMMFMAALKALLYRYTGDEAIGVISPAANRHRSYTHALIGWFANVLVFRTDLSGDPTFTELLERVREVTLGAYEHQDLSLDMIMHTLNPQPTFSPVPLPSLFYAYNSTNNTAAKVQTPQLPGLSITSISIDRGVTVPGISVFVTDMEDELSVFIEYEAQRYGDEDLSQLLLDYQTILEAVVSDPSQRLSDLPLASNLAQQALVK